MAINIVDNLNIYAPKSIDNRYLKNGISPLNINLNFDKFL